MTTTRTAHQDCTHEATKAARTACRKARAAGPSAEVLALLEVLASSNWNPSPDHWVFYGARRMAGYEGSDRIEAATAVLDHFASSGDAETDAHRRASGWTITSDPYAIRSIILRAAS